MQLLIVPADPAKTARLFRIPPAGRAVRKVAAIHRKDPVAAATSRATPLRDWARGHMLALIRAFLNGRPRTVFQPQSQEYLPIFPLNGTLRNVNDRISGECDPGPIENCTGISKPFVTRTVLPRSNKFVLRSHSPATEGRSVTFILTEER